MKSEFHILVLGLLLTACGNQDESLRRQISGMWTQEMSTYTNFLTINQDGSFAYTRNMPNIKDNFTSMGVWEIRGGEITLTATNRSDSNPLPLGELFRAGIVQLDDEKWTFRSENGSTNSFVRSE